MSQTVPAGATPLTMYIHCDTTGKWREDRRPHDRDQPRLLRLAVMIRADDGRERVSVAVVAHPPAVLVEPDAVARHGIDPDTARRIGVPIGDVLERLARMCDRLLDSEAVVLRVAAYSQHWHRRVLQREARLLQLPAESSVQRLCDLKFDDVMNAATPVVALPRGSGAGFRFPSMAVAYQHFTGEPLTIPSDPVEAGQVTLRAVQTIDAGVQAFNRSRNA